jgi:hypothetical protein
MNKDQISFQSMAEAWGCPYVAREELKRFTGGLLSPRYAANLDAQRKGIEGRIRCGRKVLYPALSVCKFLESRAQLIGGQDENK